MNPILLVKNEHKVWNNPLLNDCESGLLTQDDFKFLFPQYYNSKNFTKLLAAVMVKCEADYFRSRLSKNI